MKSKSCLLPYLAGLLSLFYSSIAKCQHRADTLSSVPIEKLEESISKKENLRQVKQDLEILKRQAVKAKDDIIFCRSIRDFIAVADLRTEDTLYFRNSAVLDTLIDDPNISATTRSILLILEAQRLSPSNHYFRFNQAAYRTNNLKHNYGALSQFQRDSLSVIFLDLALKAGPFKGDASRLLWLSSSPDIFLFEPRFEDIVISELINLPQINYCGFNPGITGLFLSLPPEKLRPLIDSLIHQQGSCIAFLKYYQRWIKLHAQDNAVALFIESLLRKQIYTSSTHDSIIEALYTKYLSDNVSSPYPAFSAHIIYQLCLARNAEGNKYPNFDHPVYGSNNNNFEEYQYYHVKALQLYQEHKPLLAKYPAFDNVLKIMEAQIQKKGVQVEIADKLPTGKDIPFKLSYKNTDSLFYRVVRLNAGEKFEDAQSETYPIVQFHYGVQNRSGIVPARLLNRSAVCSGKFIVPLPLDDNQHEVYLKLAGLPKGNYGIIFSDEVIRNSGKDVYGIAFQVTNITAINSDGRVYILNRQTGQPIAGSSVQCLKNGVPLPGKIIGKTNAAGYITISDDKINSLQIISNGDTLAYNLKIQANELSEDIYNKDKYDDLADFYDDKLKTEIFTDRSIYRPGQTVQYKIIFLTKDPNSGAPILFNTKNIGGNVFRKWLKDEKPLITLKDAFGRIVDSVKININDFGSFAGKFVLPKTAATGNWQIEGTPDIDYANSGEFRVEEYKRPTIDLSVQKQTKMLMPGEPFVIKIKLWSFTGAELSNIPISYTLNRDGMVPAKSTVADGTYENIKIADTRAFTNKNGELEVTVNDTALLKYRDSKQFQYYNYRVNAVAVDETGESMEANENIVLTSRPIKININLDKIVDRQNLQPLNVSTANDFEGNIGRIVHIKLYKIPDPSLSMGTFPSVDQWYYPTDEWNAWFPEMAYKKPAQKSEPVLVIDTIINTATYQKLLLPAEKIEPGFYALHAVCKDGEKIIGEYDNNFSVFDSQTGKVPDGNINYLISSSAKPGETLTWYSSGNAPHYTIYQAIFDEGKRRKIVKNIYEEVNEPIGLKKWVFHIPADAAGNILLNRVWVADNQIHQSQRVVYLVSPVNNDPEIIIERYKKVMAPAEQENFTIAVKTKNENTATELMTTLYDASLDKLEPHQWNLPRTSYQPFYRTQWNYSVKDNTLAGDDIRSEENSVLMREIRTTPGVMYSLQGRVAGLSVTSSTGLNEVVVVGYGSQKRMDATGAVSTVMIRGANTIDQYKQPLIILNGQVYNDKLKDISPGSISEMMVLKGADASALYGAQAANGVLIISTKGPIVLPREAEPVIKIRKDFNETAFFFPQIHADADGYYHFSFTMPETATEWRWMLYAQTKNARFAYLERKLQTRLNLMVQPNVPRLLYQGDQIKLKSRVSNLDSISVTVKAICKIEDLVTGEDITPTLVTNNLQNITLHSKSSADVSFLVTVPAAQLHPLKIVMSAQTAIASDAEEHIVPVLSSKVFTRQSVPVNFNANPVLTLASVKLPMDAMPFGMGISINQKPQAALINALPWLANYSYDCAEQTFNKLRALVIALQLMRTDSIARVSYKLASLKNKTKKPDDSTLPDALSEETMPWLNQQNQTFNQQKQLFKLFDTVATKTVINTLFDRLYKLQQPDNGLSWFDGGQSNLYISAYVLAGFGQLKQNGWKADTRENAFIRNLTTYIQTQFVSDDVNNNMDLLYALSFTINKENEESKLSNKINAALNSQWRDVNKLNLKQQALLIINTIRCAKTGDALFEKAKKQLNNIRQLAIEDQQNGLRWKDVADAEELNNTAEETVSLLAEAFDTAGENKDVDPGITKWILTTKQDQHWQTTKATAAAINLLQKTQRGTIDKTKAFTTNLNGLQLAVSDDLLNGTPDAFMALKRFPTNVSLQQQGADAQGYLTWYYFAEPKRLDTLNKAITIKKRFYIEDKIKGWVPMDPGTVLNAGDKVRVKLTIETTSKLTFVHISDPRAAAFEPADNKSGYEYNNGFNYYQSVKDTGLDIFAELLPRGVSEINYELIVAMSGHFTGGPAKLQCMYTPSAVAYGEEQKFNIN